MPRPSYRCAECWDTPDRCASCRARRAAATAERRRQRRKARLCIMCGADAVPGLRRCERHRAENAARSEASHERRFARLTAAGVCIYCSKRKAAPERVGCRACLAAKRGARSA